MRQRETEEMVEIPTASMADIAFLLILFFMVTTVFAREKGLKMVLPQKQAQTVKLKGDKLLVLSINPQGRIFAGDKEITLGDVQRVVKERLAKKPDAVILIKTNYKAPYNRTIQVFDQVKLAGATRVALGAIKPEAEAAE